jgi:Tol biopolymer transport system component
MLTACTPLAGVDATPSFDPVATAVSPTIQADTPEVINTPEPSATVLPRSLYFLGKDNQALMQVFRMEQDGKTQTQLTFEPVNVLDYDVSAHDGSLVYEIDNQLILINADGSNRRVLAEGAPRGIVRGFYHPVFSPDGQTLAYAQNGLSLYSLATGASELVLADKPLGGSESPELYQPDIFSPDGTKLLVTVGYPPDSPSATAIYSLTDKNLVQFLHRDDSPTCCDFNGGPMWSPDGTSFYGIARVPYSTYKDGELWKVDAETGAVTKLLVSSDGIVHLSKEPHLAPDGQLYFFHGSYLIDSGLFDAPALQLVRSASDDANIPILLKEDNFVTMNEALWAPDASLVLVALAPGEDVYVGGQAEIVYFDGRPNLVLTSFAQEMEWGP